jgi:TRAP-type transport system periplasmic protein
MDQLSGAFKRPARRHRTARVVAMGACLGLLFAGCGGESDPADDAEADGAADVASAEEDDGAAAAEDGPECEVDGTTTIRYSHIFGPGAALVDSVEEVQAEIEERLGGAVVFENYYGASLLGALENMPGVGSGRAEAAQIVTAYHPAEVPLWNIGMVSGLATNAEAEGRALDEMMRTHAELQAEVQAVNLKILAQNPGSGGPFVIATREPVESLDEIEGTRIRLPGGFPNQAYEMLGVDPVAISPEEAYESIQRGVVDGVYFPLDVVVATGVYEVAPHILVTGVGTTGTGGVGLNLDLWNSFDDCVQGVFEDAFSDFIEVGLRYMEEGEDASCQTILDSGGSARVLPEAEQERHRDIIGDSLVESWRQQALDTGLAEEVVDGYLDDYRALLDEYMPAATYVDGGIRCAETYEASR